MKFLSTTRQLWKIVHDRKAQEAAMENAKAKRRKEIGEVVEVVLLAALIALIITIVAWGTAEYVDFMRK
jgi:hypothetical protein